MSLITDFLNQTGQLLAAAGTYNSDGEQTLSSAVTVDCRVQEELVRSAGTGGGDIVSTTVVYLEPTQTVTAGDSFIFGGQTYQVTRVRPVQGLDATEFKKAYLGG